MTMKNKAVGIVDAYGAAVQFVKCFSESGFDVVHIQSTPELLPAFKKRFFREEFKTNVIHHGNLQETMSELKQYGLKCVIPGVEPGVELAERLSEKMGFPTNGYSKGRVRRDKYLMMKELKKNNLKTVREIAANHFADALKFATEIGFPVVIKPLDSAGSDGVHICRSKIQLERAWKEVKGKTNIIGSLNKYVLIQEFLDGDEYVVNSVSFKGRHYICSIWKCYKTFTKCGRPIYDKEVLLDYNSEIQSEILPYVCNALDALGIQYGPTHTELKMTKKGPVLLETAARIAGGINCEANTEALGHNQIQLTVDCYINPEKFISRTHEPYRKKKELYMVLVSNEHDGIVEQIDIMEFVQSLPSFFSGNVKIKPGDRIYKTTDLGSSPANFHLIHSDKKVIESDYKIIKHDFSNHLKIKNSDSYQSMPFN